MRKIQRPEQLSAAKKKKKKEKKGRKQGIKKDGSELQGRD